MTPADKENKVKQLSVFGTTHPLKILVQVAVFVSEQERQAVLPRAEPARMCTKRHVDFCFHNVWKICFWVCATPHSGVETAVWDRLWPLKKFAPRTGITHHS